MKASVCTLAGNWRATHPYGAANPSPNTSSPSASACFKSSNRPLPLHRLKGACAVQPVAQRSEKLVEATGEAARVVLPCAGESAQGRVGLGGRGEVGGGFAALVYWLRCRGGRSTQCSCHSNRPHTASAQQRPPPQAPARAHLRENSMLLMAASMAEALNPLPCRPSSVVNTRSNTSPHRPGSTPCNTGYGAKHPYVIA